MPYGLHRFQQAEALHFITFSCFHRLPYLKAPEPKSTLQAILEQTRARHQARIDGGGSFTARSLGYTRNHVGL